MSQYESGKTPENKNVLKIVAIILAAVIVIVGILFAVFKFKDNSSEEVIERETETYVEDATDLKEEISITDATKAEKEETTKVKETKAATKKEDMTLVEGYGDVYKSVVNKYRTVIAEAFAAGEEITYGELEYSFGAYPISKNSSVKFAIEDLNGDSVPELLIGLENEVSDDFTIDKCTIIEIWKYSNGEAEKIFDEGIAGKRSLMVPCQNGLFKHYYYMSGGNDTYTFYKYGKKDSLPAVIGSVGSYGNWEGVTDVKYAKYDGMPEYFVAPDKNLITKEEYDSILSQYKPISGLKWQILYTK